MARTGQESAIETRPITRHDAQAIAASFAVKATHTSPFFDAFDEIRPSIVLIVDASDEDADENEAAALRAVALVDDIESRVLNAIQPALVEALLVEGNAALGHPGTPAEVTTPETAADIKAAAQKTADEVMEFLNSTVTYLVEVGLACHPENRIPSDLPDYHPRVMELLDRQVPIDKDIVRRLEPKLRASLPNMIIEAAKEHLAACAAADVRAE